MWDRGILKSNAKVALRGRYWTAFGVMLLAALISAAFFIITKPFRIGVNDLADMSYDMDYLLAQSGFMHMLNIAGTVFFAFVTVPIIIGTARFFVQNHFGVTEFNTMFSGFQHSYMNGVGALFITYLFNFLWYLLLIIPGIVKSLEYSMVPFILADNPSIPGSRARQISRIMTNGEKGSIFVLGLSFLGWYLLGALCLGVGILFVNPYYEATMAELYIFLRDRAIQLNQVNPLELGLVAPAPYSDPTNPPVQ